MKEFWNTIQFVFAGIGGQLRQPPPTAELPGFQPTTPALIVKRLSRHKRCLLNFFEQNV